MKKGFLKVIKTTLFYSILCILSIICSRTVLTSETIQGSGTSEDPYLVNSESDLIYYLENYNEKDVYIKINQDLSLTSSYTPKSLYAILDGDFHKITAKTELITHNNGVIKNMTFTNTVERINVLTYVTSYAGILCNNNSGTISGVIATGKITNSCHHTSSGDNETSTASRAGIIAGYSSGKIINCAAFGSISLDCEYGSHAAGITSYGSVENCYSCVSVSATGSSRYGTSSKAPLTLDNSINSYFNSDIYSGSTTGAYTTSEMKTNEFINILNSNEINSDSEWTNDVNNINNGFPILKPRFDAVISSSKTNVLIDGTEDIVLTSSEPNATIYYTIDGTDPNKQSNVFVDKIQINDEITIKAIVYKGDLPSAIYAFHYSKPKGLGTKESPYLIDSEASLYAISELNKEGYFELTNNIALTSELSCLGDFYGVLNGNGYSITNVYTGSRINGLFNTNNGVITNLNVKIKDNAKFYTLGSIANVNNGIICNVQVAGSIDGGVITSNDGNAFGGLVAVNYGKIELCVVEGYVHATKLMHAGGIAGENYGDISYSMFKGNMYIESISPWQPYQGYVGGIVGYNYHVDKYVSSTSPEYFFYNGKVSYCKVVSDYIKSTPSHYTGVKVGSIIGGSYFNIYHCVDEVKEIITDINYLEWGYMGQNRTTGNKSSNPIEIPHDHDFSVEQNDYICYSYRSMTISCSCGMTHQSYWFPGSWGDYHNYDESESFIIKEATCFEEGIIGTKCLNCGYVKEEKIAKIIHEELKNEDNKILIDSDLYPYTDSTSSSNKSKTLTLKYDNAAYIEITFDLKSTVSYYSNDLNVYDGQNNLIATYSSNEMDNETVVIPGDTCKISISLSSSSDTYKCYFSAINVYYNSYTDWETIKESTCSEEGLKQRSCNICGDIQIQDIDKVTHEYIYEINEPSCNDEGYTISTCTNCSYTNTVYYFPLGHRYEATVTEATCTEQGYTTHTCVCGDTYVDSYVEPHHNIVVNPKVDSTCTATGLTEGSYCSRCDYNIPQEIIPMKNHEYATSIINPTCTEQGYTIHTCICGDSYIDAYVDIIPHSYEAVITEPTCTEQGYTTYTCICGDSYIDTYVDIIPHSYETVITEPTCTEQGYTTYTCICGDSYIGSYVDILEHAKVYENIYYDDPISLENGNYPFLLSNGVYSSTNKSHSSNSYFYVTALRDYSLEISYRTSSEANYDKLKIILNNTILYTVSGDTSWATRTIDLKAGDKLTFNYYKDGSVSSFNDTAYFKLNYDVSEIVERTEILCKDIEKTCTEDIICDLCGEIYYSAPGHNYSEIITLPTCTEQGYTTYVCHCGDEFVFDYVEPFGHELVIDERVEPTCTETGLTEGTHCSRCEYTIPQEIIPAMGHSYESYITEPTCEEQGYTTYVCHCGDEFVSDYVEALGHDMIVDEGLAPTCTENGLTEGSHCSRCEYNVPQAVIPALGHKYEIKVTEPTCEEEGYTTYTCHCGDTYKDNYVEALGHV